MAVWSIAIDIIEDVRGSIAMYLFIIEESIQAIGMATYLANRAKKTDLTKELANYAIENLIDPALDFVKNYGTFAYPLNMAYEEFYKAARKVFETYLSL